MNWNTSTLAAVVVSVGAVALADLKRKRTLNEGLETLNLDCRVCFQFSPGSQVIVGWEFEIQGSWEWVEAELFDELASVVLFRNVVSAFA